MPQTPHTLLNFLAVVIAALTVSPTSADEKSWQELAQLDRRHALLARGITAIDLRIPGRVVVTREGLEERFASIQELTTAIREVRARYQVPPREQVEVRIKAADAVTTPSVARHANAREHRVARSQLAPILVPGPHQREQDEAAEENHVRGEAVDYQVH